MTDLEKNRVYDIGEIETLKSTAVDLLNTGIDACLSWDNSISELRSLQSQTPVKSEQLSRALSGVDKLYQSDYEVEKCWIEGALNNVLVSIPQQDATGAQLLEPLQENLQLIMGMIEDLTGCIEGAATNLTLSEFREKLEGIKQDWDDTTLLENLQAFETSYIGMVENTCYGADPVNMSTGNFVYRYEDIRTGGEQALSFARTYNAMSRHKGILGRCWFHNWEKCLKEKEGTLVLYHEDGRQETFVEENHTGEREGEKTEEKAVLIYTSGQNTETGILRNKQGKSLLVEKNGVLEYYDKEGRLYRRKEGKKETHLEYEEDRLTRVYQNTGEELRFIYGNQNRLQQVTDHTGRKIQFTYEGKKLIKAEDPEGNAFTYEYGSNGRICCIRDKRNVAVLENEYDDYRRVTGQRFPDGGELTFAYQDKRKAVRLTEQNGSKTTYIHDRKFRSKKIIYEDGYEEWEYDKNGRGSRKRDKNGNETVHAYDRKGRLTETTDGCGNQTKRTYDDRGRLTQILHPNGNKSSYAYDEKGRPVCMRNPAGEETTLSYEKGGDRPVQVTYADGSRMHLSYDEKGNILSIQYPDGTGMQYGYDALSRVVETVDGNGNTTHICYDGLDRIKNVRRADGAQQSIAYNPMGEALRIEDYDGYSSSWEYNAVNKPTMYEDKQGRKTFMEYDKMWNLSRITDPEGGSTEYTYDGLNRLIQVTDSLGRNVSFTYDPNGNRKKVLYPDGTCMQYAYDALNRVVKETDRAGRCTLTEYDEMGNVCSITDNEGNQTGYVYDALNRVVKEIDRNGAVTEYTYTAFGKTDSILHPDGRKERYEYGPGGRLDKHEKGDGTWESYTYDGNGNVTGRHHRDGRSYTYTYDCLNRLTEISLNGELEKTYGYDAMGNLTSMKDGAGRETRYRYSPMGKLLSVTDAMGNRVFYSYNGKDEFTGILQMQKGEETAFLLPEEGECLLDEDWKRIRKHNEENHDLHLTLFTRDRAGQITKIEDARGREDHYTYDCMGNVIRRRDRDGEETLWEYHPDGQVSTITYPGGKKAAYTYDALARLSRVQDWLGETIFSYDKEGNLTESRDHKGQVMTCHYYPSGKRKSLCYPDGSNTEYNYNKQGNLETIQCGEYRLAYGYGEQGQLAWCKRDNGIQTRFGYDKKGRITGLIHEDDRGILDAFSCDYDPVGNRTYLKRESREEDYSFIHTYEYDALDRLIKIKEDGRDTAAFAYDGYGNRIKESRYPGVPQMSEETPVRELIYNTLNQLTDDGKNRYTYDAKGNLTSVHDKDGKALRQMTYDTNDCLIQMYENGELIQENVYNGLGIRTESICIGRKTAYTVDYTDPFHRIIREQEEEGRGRNYLWQENTLLGIPEEGIHVLSDVFHGPVRVMDKEGSLQSIYRYDEYGIMEKKQESIPLSIGYTGYIKESVSNLYFSGSREYNVEDGRFQSKDGYRYLDYSVPCGINLYAYAKNNPQRYLDFDGHEAVQEKNYLERIWEMYMLGGPDEKSREFNETLNRFMALSGMNLSMSIRDHIKLITTDFKPTTTGWWSDMAINSISFIPGMGWIKAIDQEYAKKSIKSAILGEFGNEVTALGVGMSVAIGCSPGGILFDIRDMLAMYTVKYNPQNPEWKMQVKLTALGFIPVLGELKYTKYAKYLKYTKVTGEVAEVVKNVGKYLDDVIEGAADVLKNGKKLVKTIFNNVDEATNPLAKNFDEVIEGGADAIQIGKTDLDALRNKLGVPETDTIAVGKTDVKGLEGVTFEGQSPKVRSEAGLPDLDEIWAGRNIKSPGNNPLFTRHAEEVLANDFDRAVIEAGINPQDVSGVLKIHQSNPTGGV